MCLVALGLRRPGQLAAWPARPPDRSPADRVSSRRKTGTSEPVQTLLAPPHRARLALGAGVTALLLVAVVPPLALVPGLIAVVVGADARQRDRREGRGDAMAFAGMALGALAIAIGIALVVAALGG